MSKASRDTSSPYRNYTPHRKGGPAKQVAAAKLSSWTLREMADIEDANKTIEAASMAEALLIYAQSKWNKKAAFLLPIYVKIVGERYIRCVHPEGRIEIMPW